MMPVSIYTRICGQRQTEQTADEIIRYSVFGIEEKMMLDVWRDGLDDV